MENQAPLTKQQRKSISGKKYYMSEKGQEAYKRRQERELCVICNKSYPKYHRAKHTKSIQHISNTQPEVA